jgi:hypothetical protein
VQTISDIIDVFTSHDISAQPLPLFVAADTSRFPQLIDGAVSLEQLLTAVNSVNGQMAALEQKCLTKEMISDLQTKSRCDSPTQAKTLAGNDVTSPLGGGWSMDLPRIPAKGRYPCFGNMRRLSMHPV